MSLLAYLKIAFKFLIANAKGWPADGSRRKTFSFFHVLSTRDHCHKLVKFLGKKEKHLGDRLPRALVANARERWGRGLFEGDRDDI